MSAMKRLLEQVAEDMSIEDINDPRVLSAAQRLIDQMDKEPEAPVQTRLRGFWFGLLNGCPHRHGGTVDMCDLNEMRPCTYVTGQTCVTFLEILDDWKRELGIPICERKN